ncbi:PAQR family membrane homeostasis protein TrhA [Galbibacter mesophilus]|uniref:PAQR family membrane homeostasis protein TrhA n=1 Tax=Galbibacter mesophilus TaxID=379069 RepID=UPI00191CA4F1|nr:hemolysin III family protein [Galbibacter mesophilus]MCM5664282.1 hemolysin III family protein [Galbibacter mesophilus]
MHQTKKEELWNAVTHGVGAVLSLVGLVVLLTSDNHKTEFSTLSIWMYGLSAFLLFSISTLYHSVSDAEKKIFLRKLDHISIYFLIAGTYTPVCLIALENGSGWSMFWVVWGITAVGMILKLFFTGKFEYLSLLLYLAMGWLIIFDVQNLIATLSRESLTLLIVGGLFYTVGVVFYAIKRIPYYHVIWHFFVLGGAISHYFMVLSLV